MHEIFLQRYCMKWIPGDPQKEIINWLDKMTFFRHKSNYCTSILFNKENTKV